jgi:hypothetical protein
LPAVDFIQKVKKEEEEGTCDSSFIFLPIKKFTEGGEPVFLASPCRDLIMKIFQLQVQRS